MLSVIRISSVRSEVKPTRLLRYATFLLLCTVIIGWSVSPSLVYGQAIGMRKNTVADETTKVKSNDYTYYTFTVDPSWINIEFTGGYEEDKDRDVIITLYDASTCNAPISSEDFNKDTCKVVFKETDSSGFIDKNISPGKYILTVESADDSHGVKATVHFDVKYDLSSTAPTHNIPSPLPQAVKGTAEYYCIQYHDYIQKSEEDCHTMFHGNTPTSAAALFIGCTLMSKVVPAIVPQLRPAEPIIGGLVKC